MIAKLEYDWYVDRLKSAPVAALVTVCAFAFIFSPGLAPTVVAQINGTPASVTSINSGGHFSQTPGVPASVTSIGPGGIQPGNQFFPSACCINPLFPVNPNPPLFQRHRHRGQGSFFPAGGAVYVPYPVVAEPDVSDTAPEANPPDDDRGGPTIFDRRGSGQSARSYVDDYPRRTSRIPPDAESAPSASPAETPVADEPQTVLVFKDGHRAEVQNYAVVGNMLYDLTPGHHRKIAIADLDLKATAQQNDDLGIGFQLPPASQGNNRDANKPEVNKEK